MSIILDGTNGIVTPDIDSGVSTLGPLTQALNLGSTGQVVFPATQNASSNANTLDDYEEGTFSPTFGGWTGEYSQQTGTYIKIGRFVHLRGGATTVADATKSFTEGFMLLQSLPFEPLRATAAPQIDGGWSINGTTNTTASIFKFGFWDGIFPNNAVDGSGGNGRGNFATSNLSPGTSVNLRFTMTYITET